MNDIYELKHYLDTDFMTALEAVIRATDSLNIPYFIAGATARDIVLHGIFGHAPGRATRDIDTAIFVENWAEYDETRSKLISAGLGETGILHRLREPQSALPVDIIPFGALEDKSGQIQWPPKYVETMSVIGFSEAYESSINVSHNDLVFRVASLPGIGLMKLVAWSERGLENPKDAADFYHLLSKYQVIHQDRIWESYVPDDFNCNVELVTAFLLGFDMKSILKHNAKEILYGIRDKRLDELITGITKDNRTVDIDQLEMQLNAFWRGLS